MKIGHTAGMWLFVGALLGALTGCGNSSVTSAPVDRAGPHVLTAQLGGSGRTAAGTAVDVIVDDRAQVVTVAVQPGDAVHRGQSLIGFDPTPFVVAAARLTTKLKALQASIANAAAHRAAADPGHVGGIDAQITALEGQASLVAQQLDIAEGRGVQILSPIDGVVGAVNVEAGQYASPGAVLIHVEQLASILVTAHLPIADRSSVVPGAPTAVHILELPGVELQGKVLSVPPDATNSGQEFTATILVPNTTDQEVVPNMQAYVTVTVRRTAAVAIARSAVAGLDGDPTVDVLDGKVAHRVHVEVGDSDGSYVEILHGLSRGQLCLADGTLSVGDGTAVRVTATEG